MTTILYPTRGGHGSYPNQDQVIALARERDMDILFLHVSDVHFLDKIASPVLIDVAAELAEMAEFLLAMAEERAQKAGVPSSSLVRQGDFRAALRETLVEEAVDTVVLGTPAAGTGITTREYLDHLAGELVAEFGIEVLRLEEGAIVQRVRPLARADANAEAEAETTALEEE